SISLHDALPISQGCDVAPVGRQRTVLDQGVIARGGSGAAGGDGRVLHDSTLAAGVAASRPPPGATRSCCGWILLRAEYATSRSRRDRECGAVRIGGGRPRARAVGLPHK